MFRVFIHNMSHQSNQDNIGSDQKSGDAVDRMGVALFFCFMSIVMVVGLYLCFWAKVEKANQKNTNRHNIKILEREVERLSRKVLWLEGSMAVAECEDRVRHYYNIAPLSLAKYG